MPKKKVTIDNLGDLDKGIARGIINHALNQAIQDTDDRGDDGKERKVTITVSFKKMDSGFAGIRVETAVTMPKQATGGTIGKVGFGHRGEPTLEFEELAPDNPDQQTIDYPELKREQE